MKSSSGLSKRVARLTKGTASGRLRESVGLDVRGHEPDAIQPQRLRSSSLSPLTRGYVRINKAEAFRRELQMTGMPAPIRE